jgi:antitoxin HicB
MRDEEGRAVYRFAIAAWQRPRFPGRAGSPRVLSTVPRESGAVAQSCETLGSKKGESMFTFAYPAVSGAMKSLGSSIAFAMAGKADVPKPSRLKRGQKLVPVPLWIVAKLALYWAIRELGMSQSELARRLKVRETVVRRMLDPNHDTRPEKIQAALEALGKRVVMAYSDAA